MIVLIAGLFLFLGLHSTRALAGDWRGRMLQRWGETRWKVAYALLSLGGLMLVGRGYGVARLDPVVLWTPPVGLRHASSLLVLAAFILLVATYVPRNSIRARVHHPMLLATMLWAFGHLLANGTLLDVVLFGSFLVWATVTFAASLQRDRALAVVYPPGALVPTIVTVVIGAAAWAAVAFWLHVRWFGVQPFG
jgi:uncharacterized membrane protein